jgi:hypothetical protein
MLTRNIAALALATVALTACGDDTPTGPGTPTTASVKVIHAVADAPPVDVRIDEAAPAITGLAFGSTAPASGAGYVELPSGNRRIRVLAGGAAVIDATPALAAATNYTIIATGRASGTPAIAPLVLTDDITAPAAGNIRIRIVHGAATVPNVDVYVTAAGSALPSTAALTNVPFRGAAYLPAVPAGSYRVCVVLAGSGTAGGCAIDVTTGAIQSGVVATAVALDPAPGAQAPGALLTVDRQP